jgi:hypothetical protein
VAGQVKYVLLYRTPSEWRITVGTADELACGALEAVDASAPFHEAVLEFEALLKREWEFDGPLAWDELKPDWWGWLCQVDLAPS